MINTFRASIESKLFNEIVNRFYQNHLQDQIQTLQSGKNSSVQQGFVAGAARTMKS
jgi:hypothetical protein